jgi:hypothetical protein
MSRKKDSLSDIGEGEPVTPAAPTAGIPPAPVDFFKAFEDAYRDYTLAVQKSWSQEDLHKSIENAHRNYLKGLLETFEPNLAHKRFDVCRRYHQELQEAWFPEIARQRLDESFRNYLRALQKAWNQLNVDEIDPHALARISHSIFAGAGLAGNTVVKRQEPAA